MSRLGYFLMSLDIAQICHNCKISTGYRSDHSLISAELNFSHSERGNGTWKFNNSLLVDGNYKKAVLHCIEDMIYVHEVKNDADNDPLNFKLTTSDQLFLEVLKSSIRGVTIEYASRKKKLATVEEITLIKEIEKLKMVYENNNTTEDCDNYQHAQNNLRYFREKTIKGHILRSKSQWHKEGEHCSKFFL